MDWIGAILGAIIIGVILGVLARIILPGKQNISVVLTIVVGVVAAFIGSLIAGAFGVADTPGFNWIEHTIQLVLALIGIGAVAGYSGRKGVRQ